MQEAKPIWQSKTLWANVIAIGALLLQTYTGFVIDPEKQVGLLGMINVVLRLITKKPVNWGSSEQGVITLRLLPLLLLGALCLALLPACASNPRITAGKSLLAAKATIVSAAQATDGLCKTRVLDEAKCRKAKETYELAKPLYDSTVDAYLLMSDGGDPQRFNILMQSLQETLTQLTAIAGGAQ